MTVGDIIKAVRWCFDEESSDAAGFVSANSGDTALMDNIIKAKIGYALRWVCLYAPAELLSGSDSETDAGIVSETTIGPTHYTPITDSSIGIEDGAPSSVQYNLFSLPANFLRLVRVRATGWHRAVTEPIQEGSDEYLQLHDPTCAYATPDRPQAAIINTKRKRLEVWPAPSGSSPTVSFTCIVAPTSITTEPITADTIAIPPLVQAAFIYYLAHLVLSAYGDPRSANMLEIAKMNLGK